MTTSYTHLIPTPPFSPQNYRMTEETVDNPLKSTINLLDSLVAFYQQERMWVYRTRATLEEAFENPPILSSNSSSSYQGSNNGKSSNLRSFNDFNESGTSSAGHGLGHEDHQQPTRWMRRKKGFKLRLDGIRARRVISTQQDGQSTPTDQLQPREQILEMFEKMMETRMESCQRVNKLVRDANRAALHYR